MCNTWGAPGDDIHLIFWNVALFHLVSHKRAASMCGGKFTLKMETAGSSETSVHAHYAVRCHIEDDNR
jgi:hypothetical protein